MADKQKTPAQDEPKATTSPQVIETLPSVANQISALASANAPFIYFDAAPFLGHIAGVGQITLTAVRYMGAGPELRADRDLVVTGHLRASLPALRSLRAAIDQAEESILKSMAPAGGGGMAH